MRVEAGRDEHELGRERGDRRSDDAVERVEVLRVARPCAERDVERRLGLVVRAAAAGIERPLVERDEEDAVVVPEDRLGPVPVMDVPVDDRHALEPELALGDARRDGDVVEDAEAHRAPGERVVARRPHEREAAAQRRLDRRARRERRSLVRRLGAERVAVEPDRRVAVANQLDVLGGVAQEKLVLPRRAPLAPDVLVAEEDGEPLGALRMAARRVQPRHRRMRQDVDELIPARAPSPRGRRGRDRRESWTPPPTLVLLIARGGRGAEASIVAIRR